MVQSLYRSASSMYLLSTAFVDISRYINTGRNLWFLSYSFPSNLAIFTMLEDAANRNEESKGSVHASELGTNQELSYQTTQSENPFFVRNLQYSRDEEARVVRILDTRLFPCVLMTTWVPSQTHTYFMIFIIYVYCLQICAQHGPHKSLECNL